MYYIHSRSLTSLAAPPRHPPDIHILRLAPQGLKTPLSSIGPSSIPKIDFLLPRPVSDGGQHTTSSTFFIPSPRMPTKISSLQLQPNHLSVPRISTHLNAFFFLLLACLRRPSVIARRSTSRPWKGRSMAHPEALNFCICSVVTIQFKAIPRVGIALIGKKLDWNWIDWYCPNLMRN